MLVRAERETYVPHNLQGLRQSPGSQSSSLFSGNDADPTAGRQSASFSLLSHQCLYESLIYVFVCSGRILRRLNRTDGRCVERTERRRLRPLTRSESFVDVRLKRREKCVEAAALVPQFYPFFEHFLTLPRWTILPTSRAGDKRADSASVPTTVQTTMPTVCTYRFYRFAITNRASYMHIPPLCRRAFQPRPIPILAGYFYSSHETTTPHFSSALKGLAPETRQAVVSLPDLPDQGSKLKNSPF